MAFYDTTWYLNSVGYAAVTARPQNTAVAAGVIRRQFTAPSVGNERCFVCIVAGTTANVTDATWVLTRGAKTTDGTVTWQECTGASAVNGDLTNTVNWTAAKAAGAPSLGAIIQRNSGASYQICTTAGTMAASEPSFSDTAGVTTNDGTSVWTSLGIVANFTAGGAPHARLQAAFAANWFAAGNTIYVGDNHAEAQGAALAIAVSGAVGVGKVICHNHSASYPPAAGDITTGATISTTGNFALSFTSATSLYIYGITFKAGVGGTTNIAPALTIAGSNSSSVGPLVFDNCSFQIASTNTSNFLQFGSQTANVLTNILLNNTTVSFANVAQRIWMPGAQLRWTNTGQILAAGSSVPAVLFITEGLQGPMINIVLEALDLSQFTGTLMTNLTFFNLGTLLVKDCNLNAAMTLSTPGLPGFTTQLARCDSGATAYKSSRYAYEGTETTETSITRVGGAVDPAGQAQTRKIVTTANAQWLRPFKAEPYAIWNATTGATVTVTVYGTVNAGAVPNNDDLFMEVEYLSSSGSPLGAIISTTKSNLLAANAAVASDSSSWNGGGSGAGWSPFKLVATLSSPQPAMAGVIEARIRAAKASTTYYIDPQPVLT